MLTWAIAYMLVKGKTIDMPKIFLVFSMMADIIIIITIFK